MPRFFLLFLIFLAPSFTAGQICPSATSEEFLHGNEIKATITANGSLFNQGNGGDGSFMVPYSGPGSPSTIFTSGLWMGGIDPGGNLKLSAITYTGSGDGFAGGQYDPLTGVDSEICENWDKVFSVKNYEIFAHLDDFNADQVVDHPIAAIYGWPGRGNPHFADIQGFEIPDLSYGLAPFFDQDGDGVYNPDFGDYPYIPQSESIPSQMTFSIYNDVAAGNDLGALPLGMEVHLTTWSFYCQNEDPLNRAIFTSHKFIYKAVEPVDSLRIGFFIDADLGCYTDDYIGTAPDLNTVYVYNQDNVDGEIGNACPGGITTYGENAPVQAITPLNHPLDKTIAFNNASLNNPPPGTSDPFNPVEFYRYLNGQWRDGTPLTSGGDGYDPLGTPTDFIFPDNPNDPGGWSMYNEDPASYDRRIVYSFDFGLMQPGQIEVIDQAWVYVRTPGLSHIENVNEMELVIPEIQANYDASFQNACVLNPVCTVDCVWPGDTNNDGIANHEDLLPIGVAHQFTGPERNGLLYWAPWTASNWMEDLPTGSNFKHIDADADGAILAEDIELIENHYNLVTPWYEAAAASYPIGPELYWEPIGPTTSLDDLEPGDNFFINLKINPVPELYGIAFTIEVDDDYLENITALGLGDCDGACWTILPWSTGILNDGKRELDVAVSQKDGSLQLSDHFGVNLIGKINTEFPDPLPSNSTSIRLRNIVAVDAQGNLLDIGATEPILTIPSIVVNGTQELEKASMSIYPNPVTEALII